jgi:hypothetical protein
MKLKSLLHFLTSPTESQKAKFKGQKAVLLKVLIRGRPMSSLLAVQMTGSPSAVRRLQELKRDLRQACISYTTKSLPTKMGNAKYDVIRLPADQREKARGLLGGAR